MSAPDPKPDAAAEFLRLWCTPPGSPAIDHGCMGCTQTAPPVYRCIPCSDKEAYAAAAVARGLALEEAEQLCLERADQHWTSSEKGTGWAPHEDLAKSLESVAKAIAALRGAT